MKLACSSSAFHELLRSGDLTQLEWIDLCANELLADGVVFDVRHFPRTDIDYLAQTKKMATDIGLTVAALYDPACFESEQRAHASLDFALALGAPLLAAPLPPQTAMSWSDLQNRLSAASGIAKRLNVTLALMNEPGSFASTTHEMKRVTKEGDSAWLRYAPRLNRFDAVSEPQTLLSKAVIAWTDASAGERAKAATLRLLEQFRAFLVLDADGGDASVDDMKNALRAWRRAADVSEVVDRT